jgi:DNA-binding IclR family transcriptional regulator
LLEPLLLLTLAFCHTGKEMERLYLEEDKNAFLSVFNESIEDQMTRVSVRASAIEMIQSVFFGTHKDVVETVIGHLWCGNIPEGAVATPLKLSKLKSATDVTGITISQDIAYAEP